MATKEQFPHGKQFVTTTGKLITVKAFVTINHLQHIECYEDKGNYKPEGLTPVHEEAEAYSPNH